jgi:PAS domain S-box-containing protein
MRVLHLEDNPADAELVRALVVREWPDCEVTWVADRTAFLTAVRGRPYDLILSDFALNSFNGLEALQLARAHWPDTPFIFVSGNMGEDRAVDALRSGAQDYVLKDRMKRLPNAIARILRESDERRKRREAENRSRELGDLLNQAREAIFITDLDDRLIYWNAGAERVFGWRQEDVMNRRTADIFGADVPVLREETLTRGEWAGELRLTNRNRQPLVIESRQSLIRDDEGHPKARLSINTDITDHKRLEEQLLRAQRLENIGMLAAGIAHDLNNMLAPILLATPMLRDHVGDPSALNLLSALEQSAERGANLVRQILSFAHGATGEKRPVQLRHLVRDIGFVINGTFPKAIRLEEAAPAGLWPVEANPTQIHQVLLNLCVNARDAMPTGGVLRLRAENRVLDLAEAAAIDGGRPGAFVVLQVEDTGTGIAPDLLARIWEPFFTTKEAGKGTGLGLSTVRAIIENHQGFISLRTAPGQGACFRVYLPAAEGPEVEGAAPVPKALPAGKGELILVVDDEVNVRELTRTILGRSGYRTIVAVDGAEAAAMFARYAAEIRLVMTDLQMPNLDGQSLCRALRRLNPAVKLIAFSGMSESLSTLEPLASEFADVFLAKPFRPEALLAAVHSLLRPAGSGSSNTPWAPTR